MSLTPLTFTPTTGYKDSVTFPDPVSEEAARAQIQELHDQTKTYIVDLIAELLSTANGKGASQIGLEDSAGRFTAKQVDAALAELAGSGRTEETVKGVADSVSSHISDDVHIGNNQSARVYHNTTQSLATATDTYLAFNSERFDNATMHDNSTNNSRLTCPETGKYLIVATIGFTSNSTGNRVVRLVKNRTDIIAGVIQPAAVSDSTEITVTTIASLTAGDYVEVRANQNSGGSLNVEYFANLKPEFMMAKIG